MFAENVNAQDNSSLYRLQEEFKENQAILMLRNGIEMIILLYLLKEGAMNYDTIIAERLTNIRHEVAKTALQVGRDANGITILTAVKTQTPERILSVIRNGIRDLGENRLQEAVEKRDEVVRLAEQSGIAGDSLRWHFIGRLQSNKLRKIAEYFSVVQSVDNPDHAVKLSGYAGEFGKQIDIFFEISAAGESSKGGIDPSAVEDFAAGVMELPNLHVRGLMTIGPLTDDSVRIIECYNAVARAGERLKAVYPQYGGELSMGMSGDYSLAITAGSTMIRIGTALFGAR